MIALSKVMDLVRGLLDAETTVNQLEAQLSAAKEKARVLREETIPGVMQELGLLRFTLETGQEITIKQEVYASLPEDNKEEAFTWLEEHNFGGLIKTLVITEMGKGLLTDARELTVELQKRGLTTDLTRMVHPQTLKAFLREQIAAAKTIPLDLFGARPVWTTKLK